MDLTATTALEYIERLVCIRMDYRLKIKKICDQYAFYCRKVLKTILIFIIRDTAKIILIFIIRDTASSSMLQS
jgi:hypothetical protein